MTKTDISSSHYLSPKDAIWELFVSNGDCDKSKEFGEKWSSIKWVYTLFNALADDRTINNNFPFRDFMLFVLFMELKVLLVCENSEFQCKEDGLQ